jgi:hypothetical protein
MNRRLNKKQIEKLNTRFVFENIPHCGECKHLFNGICQHNKQVTYSVQKACHAFDVLRKVGNDNGK